MKLHFFIFWGYLATTTDAKLRGVNNMDDLKQRATHPIVRSDLRGKTVRDLGVHNGASDELPDDMTEKKGISEQKGRKQRKRSLEGNGVRTLQFFSVRAK